MTTHTPGGSARSCIVLIGLRGCGKSTVGRELASLVGGTYVDTDDLIAEQAGKSVAIVFEEEGEAGFRRREREVIARAAADEPAVISVGGGAVLDKRNTRLLHAAGKLVWLTASADVLWKRMQADPGTDETRPALTHLPGLAEVEHLLAKRSPLYEAAADLIIETTGLVPSTIATQIVRGLSAGPPGS